jgi:hypothetical protein
VASLVEPGADGRHRGGVTIHDEAELNTFLQGCFATVTGDFVITSDTAPSLPGPALLTSVSLPALTTVRARPGRPARGHLVRLTEFGGAAFAHGLSVLAGFERAMGEQVGRATMKRLLADLQTIRPVLEAWVAQGR